MSNKLLAAASGILLNATAGFYMLMVPQEQMPALLYWGLVVFILMSAGLSIFTFGLLGLGWSGVMSDIEVDGWQPGSDRVIDLYNSTINALAGYTRTRFYFSFAGSITLMAGLSHQGWMFLLVLEVLGSAIGYGFIYWVMNNVAAMYERAHGKNV